MRASRSQAYPAPTESSGSQQNTVNEGAVPTRRAPVAAASPVTQRASAARDRAPRPLSDEEFKQRNFDDLATVIYNEARQQGELAMTAVGSTVWNRMLRNHVSTVRSVWQGYERKAPDPKSPGDRAALLQAHRIAEGILNGTTADPTHGATHYYSPQAMPKENESIAGRDVGGGLETVPGVRHNGGPVRSYVPSYVPEFIRKPVTGVPERDFKFYEQPIGRSRVR